MFKTISNWMQAIFALQHVWIIVFATGWMAGWLAGTQCLDATTSFMGLELMMVNCGQPLFGWHLDTGALHTVVLTQFSISDWRMGQWQINPFTPTSWVRL
jgi:hypothetical protein